MNLPQHLTDYAVAVSLAPDPLQQRRELQLRQLGVALRWGLLTLLVSLPLALFFFRDTPQVPIFTPEGFPEWVIGIPEFGVGFDPLSVPRELGISLENLAAALMAFLRSGSSGQIAAVARLIACAALFVAILVTYRELLPQRYALTDRHMQRRDLERRLLTPGYALGRVAVALAAVIAGYVLLTILWLVLAAMFKNFAAPNGLAAVISALFAGAVAFAAAYGALTLTTHRLMALGLITLLAGLAGSFALAGVENGQQWWQAAISRAGAHPNAAWLFTATFGAVFLVFVALWFDVEPFLRLAVAQAEVTRPPGEAGDAPLARLRRWLRANAFGLIRALFFLSLFGLLGAGFVRTDARDVWTTVVHTGGAVLSITILNVGGLAFAYWFPDPILGTSFRRMSWVCVGVTSLSVVLWPLGVFNLTGVELVALATISIWLALAVDNILAYVNALPEAGRAET